MSALGARQPLTLKGILVVVAAGILYLVGQFLGIDLTGSDRKGDGRTPDGTAPQQEEAPRKKAPRTQPRAPESGTPAPDAGAIPGQGEVKAPTRRDDSAQIQRYFRGLVSGQMVEAKGEIVHILPVDNEGDRHQVFLVELTNGITLKIAHNIDLAPEVPITKRDRIRFFGQYEYNDKGGVVHWTHHDPGQRRAGGWLEHNGKKYE